MKEITMYELLGMIKDEKQPKHIRYRDEEWWWGYDTYTYFADLNNTPDAQSSLFSKYRINYCLDDEVEIIEEDKKIEQIDKEDYLDNESFEQVDGDLDFIIDKINELIDEVNKLKDESN